MIYELKLNENEMSTLLSVIKADAKYAIDEELPDVLQEDIDLLTTVAHSFKNEDAKLKLQSIISGYEKELRQMS